MALILVVEDDADVLEMICQVLEGYDYKVCSALNGKEGVEVFKKHKPDAVLTDIRMPIMDGFEMLYEIDKVVQDVPSYSFTGYPNDLLRSGLGDKVKFPQQTFEKPLEMDAVLRAIRVEFES